MSEAKGKRKGKDTAGNLSTLALAMMNVAIVAGLANDVQQAFYGLTSITYFVIGAIVFFIPTGLVAAELAGGWSERGGIFRWVGEGIGSGWAFVCIFILWFQTAFNFGSGISASSATIGFFTPDYDWAVDFAKADDTTRLIPIMLCWLAFYWLMCFFATKGITWFARISKYGVFIGTLIPLAVMTILCIVYIATGHTVNLDPAEHGLIPKWEGMSTLALAAGVFFSFTGIDMNAAHIKQLKDPARQFPAAIFIAMILALIIFILGTIIIAIVIPNGQIDIVYTLYATYETLGSVIGMPWLYMVFVYAGLGATMAMLITNLAGPSLMLGSAGRSGFLPKFLQNNNKHNMPSRLMYFQMIIMTLISFVVIFLPNVEGFFALVTQAITILYLIYYILMFIAFLRLRYTQPNRPRTFKIPGGNFFAWVVAGVGIAACLFGITLAFYPPAQIAKEVGSGFNYVMIIAALIAAVLLISFGIYFISRKKNWVDPANQFAPFTWQIEGLKKPGRVESNVPVEMMSRGQNAMGMPIARPYDPNAHIVLPPQYLPHKKKKGKGGNAAATPPAPMPSHPATMEQLAANMNQIKTGVSTGVTPTNAMAAGGAAMAPTAMAATQAAASAARPMPDVSKMAQTAKAAGQMVADTALSSIPPDRTAVFPTVGANQAAAAMPGMAPNQPMPATGQPAQQAVASQTAGAAPAATTQAAPSAAETMSAAILGAAAATAGAKAATDAKADEGDQKTAESPAPEAATQTSKETQKEATPTAAASTPAAKTTTVVAAPAAPAATTAPATPASAPKRPSSVPPTPPAAATEPDEAEQAAQASANESAATAPVEPAATVPAMVEPRYVAVVPHEESEADAFPDFLKPEPTVGSATIASSVLSKNPDVAAIEAAQWAQEAADQARRLAALSKALKAEADANIALMQAREAALEAHAAAQQAALEITSGTTPKPINPEDEMDEFDG